MKRIKNIALIFFIMGKLLYSSNLVISGEFNNSEIIIAESGNAITLGETVTSVQNTGVISALSGNAFHLNNTGSTVYTIGNITNNGIILAQSKSGSGSGNGVYIYTNSKNSSIGEIINRGIISGYSQGTQYFLGFGIYIRPTGLKLSNIINSGIISGFAPGLASGYAVGNNSVTLINDGILAGNEATSAIDYVNNGIEIILNRKEEVGLVNVGNGGVSQDGKTIFNGTVYNVNETKEDSFVAFDINENYNNSIINGVGSEKGAFIISSGTNSIENLTVNGYRNALYLEDDANLTMTDVILNGKELSVRGSEGNNSIAILGDSIINGKVSLGDGDDILTISNGTQVNGILNGGPGTDILNLGTVSITRSSDSLLKLYYDIQEFETLNTNGNINLTNDIKINNVDNINIQSGNLILTIDSTQVDSDGKITGHSLYENSGTVSSSGGNLVIDLNGMGVDTVISMGNTTLDSNIDGNWWEEGDHLKTNSLILDGKLSDDGKEVKITVLESIPLGPSFTITPATSTTPIIPDNSEVVTPESPDTTTVTVPDTSTDETENESSNRPSDSLESSDIIDASETTTINGSPIIDIFLYEKLNKIYQSIVSAGEIGILANTTLVEETYEDSLKNLLTILDQIYVNNPYAYTLKAGKDSLKLFENNLSYLTITPKKNEIIVQGKSIYSGLKNDSCVSGKNYYGFSVEHRAYKTITNIVGGLGVLEYGMSNKASIGIAIGGNHQDIKFKQSNKIKGDSFYIGSFVKKSQNNFLFKGGIGYQYTSNNATRHIFNDYDFFNTGDKYNTNSMNIFGEIKYRYEGIQNWRAEPKLKLSYYHIEQDKINERYSSNQLSMGVKRTTSNTTDLNLGIDFIKTVNFDSGKLKNIFAFDWITTLGNREKELEGYILGNGKVGNKFTFKGVEVPKVSGKVEYILEFEQSSRVIYMAGVSLEFAKKSNRNVNANLGIGYKF